MAEKKTEKQKVYDFEEARRLPASEIAAGLKVKGDAMPFGGSWVYDKAADELTLREPPTRDPEAKR